MLPSMGEKKRKVRVKLNLTSGTPRLVEVHSYSVLLENQSNQHVAIPETGIVYSNNNHLTIRFTSQSK